jgi:hypothetical protein
MQAGHAEPRKMRGQFSSQITRVPASQRLSPGNATPEGAA